MNLVMLLTFRVIGFGWNGDGILLSSSIQSQKLVAVWTTLEPLPLIVANPVPIVLGLIVLGSSTRSSTGGCPWDGGAASRLGPCDSPACLDTAGRPAPSESPATQCQPERPDP